ncbi:MAG: gluconokinase [Pseudomonadota bacterium]
MTRCFVLMGVMGSGKTSVGEALAAVAKITFVDGDSLHPPANIEKMSTGIPLTDDDRAPWLVDVGRCLARTEGRVAIGCSALKRAYRDIIRAEAQEAVRFLHLHTTRDVLAERVTGRGGHFMPPALLDSQLATLEPLASDEDGVVIDIDASLDAVIEAVVAAVG